jgi:hypothetical protein
MKKGRGNISIKLTNILKQTQECCNKKKCPKGTKRCKPSKKKKKKDEDEGIFGGMPNIKPTSRAIPMPQSVMNNITPVPNIPLPRQLPSYSQFRRPHAMYQRNDRPLQVQQGRGIRQPQTQPLTVSTGIQTARRQAIAQTQTRAKARTSIETQTQDIPRQQLTTQQMPPISVQRGQRLTTQQLPPISVQSGIRGRRVIATQTPKQLNFNTPPQPRPIPILNQAPPKNIFTEQPRPRPIPILNQAPPPIYRGLLDQQVPIFINPTKTRGVRSDREIRGSQGTADQPFNAEAATPNILDYEGILMRNAEEDRRLAQRRRQEMSERFKSTIKDIGQGTPRDDEEEKEQERPASPPEVIVFSDTDEELTTPQEEALTQQIESVKQLIGDEEVAMNQGQPGFVDDQIEQRETRPQIDDTPIRRGRPSRAAQAEVARRRQYFIDNPARNPYGYRLPHNEIFNLDPAEFNNFETNQATTTPQEVPMEDMRRFFPVIPATDSNRPTEEGASLFV